MGVCVRAQDENKCWRRLQVLRAAGRGCLYQNPSGGRECGERDAEGKRLWEIVETTGKSMRKQSGRRRRRRRRRRRERESSELSEERLRWGWWGTLRDRRGWGMTDRRKQEWEEKKHRARGWNEPDSEGITCSSATRTAVRAGRPPGPAREKQHIHRPDAATRWNTLNQHASCSELNVSVLQRSHN